MEKNIPSINLDEEDEANNKFTAFMCSRGYTCIETVKEIQQDHIINHILPRQKVSVVPVHELLTCEQDQPGKWHSNHYFDHFTYSSDSVFK